MTTEIEANYITVRPHGLIGPDGRPVSGAEAGLVDDLHDFTITEHADGRLEVNDPPPVGALSAFACALLADTVAERGVGVDDEGRLVILGLVFEPVRFDSGGIQFGQPHTIVCRRVA